MALLQLYYKYVKFGLRCVACESWMWNSVACHHHIVIHNGATHFDLLGPGSQLTGFSSVHNKVKGYLTRSVGAGKPWAAACDEPGDAGRALRPDNDTGNSREDGRKNGLWGTLMAGGWGNEWCFGCQHAHSYLTCEDFRSRDNWWDYCRFALEFFTDNSVPFWLMQNDNALSSTARDHDLTSGLGAAEECPVGRLAFFSTINPCLMFSIIR